MDKLNSGLPPKGEQGMCRVDENSGMPGWQFWCGSYFTGFSTRAENAREYAIDGGRRSMHQGLPWRWATRSELLADGVPESDVGQMLHESQKGERPKSEQAAFEEWLLSACPSGDCTAVQNQWLASHERECWLEDQPSQAEVESTQEPQSPEQYVADMLADEADKHERMLKRDREGAAPQRTKPRIVQPWSKRDLHDAIVTVQRQFRAEAIAEQAFVEWPRTPRLGIWS